MSVQLWSSIIQLRERFSPLCDLRVQVEVFSLVSLKCKSVIFFQHDKVHEGRFSAVLGRKGGRSVKLEVHAV